MLASALSYYALSSTRFVDMLPMTLDHHYLRAFADGEEQRVLQGLHSLANVEAQQRATLHRGVP